MLHLELLSPMAVTGDSVRRTLVSVVMPAFNEEELVGHSLQETVDVLDGLGVSYEIVLVDDGSRDGTLERAREAARRLPRVRVIGSEVNLGKGSALSRGAYASVGDLVLFLDADLEVHPRQLRLLLDRLESNGTDVVIGSKLHRDSSIEYPPGRRLMTLAYYLLVRTLFRLPVRDTQTGLKLYRREVLARVVPRLLVKRFAYDLELLVNAHRLGYEIVEVPVVVTRQRPYPRIGPRDVFHVMLDTAAIWYRTYLLRYYDKVGVEIDRVLAETPPFTAETDLEELAG